MREDYVGAESVWVGQVGVVYGVRDVYGASFVKGVGFFSTLVAIRRKYLRHSGS